jgi:hypothetical protein
MQRPLTGKQLLTDRAPAPCITASCTISPLGDGVITTCQPLANQIYIAIKHLGADDDLLSIIDRWATLWMIGETLRLLTDYHFGAKPLHQPKF